VTEPWWKSAVFYQIYPRSFCDTTGTGVGDLNGVIAHLDHLSWLGVDAIWLSPIFTSPMVDHGYDVSDYCDIDPMFGDLDTIDRLIAQCHERDIRVILDWVPNHSSDQHPWFLESRSSRESAKRDWYIWRDGTPETVPNNWQAEFPKGPAWAWDEPTQAWYLHMFAPGQPDLNWANPDVRAAMHETLRFWLDRGVDGFRMDVVHAIGKPDGLPDREDGPGRPLTEFDNAVTHEYLRDIRSLLDEYDGDRMAVGEVYILDTYRVATYYGDNDELHLSFNFVPLWTDWNAKAWRKQIEISGKAFDPINAWSAWVLSNHDVPRHRTRYGGDERKARAAAVLLLCLRGTPFLYAGEEFGLLDADVPPELTQDPAGVRDGCRAPIPWDATATHGWKLSDNWLPFPPGSDIRNAETQRSDPESMANLYHAITAARRASPALRLGSLQLLQSPSDAVAFERKYGEDRRIVIINMGDAEADISEIADGWETQLRTDTSNHLPRHNTIPAQSAMVLRQ
jgi:alpha-glucosidase